MEVRHSHALGKTGQILQQDSQPVWQKRWQRMAGLVLLGIAVASCGGGGGDDALSPAPAPAPASVSAQFVTGWNAITVEAFSRYEARARADSTDSVAPLVDSDEERLCTMIFAAMHDALNAVVRRYAPAMADLRDAGADAGAALASAAHQMLVSLLPSEQAYIDAQYTASLATRAEGPARDAGVALGQAVARAVLAARANDGWNAPGPVVYSSHAPGEYRFTRCPQDAAQANFADCGPIKSNWPSVKLWALPSLDGFRAPNPYGVPGTDKLAILAATMQAPGYVADFEEVKLKGLAGAGNTRTADESVMAMFWEEASHRSWNRAALTVAQAKGLDAWQQARLTALLHLAIADAWIAVYEGKWRYGMWRPVTAIHYADQDDNPQTALFNCPPDNVYCWERFGRATPSTQEYPSAHAALGGAAERVLAAVAGGDAQAFSMTARQGANPSQVLTGPQLTRRFTSFSQAARENALSRIYIGFHFRESTRVGLAQGESVGDYVAAHALVPQ